MTLHANPFQRVLSNLSNASAKSLSSAADDSEQDTLDMLLSAMERFCEQHVDEIRHDSLADIPSDVYSAAAKMGLFGLNVEPGYGGAGLSLKAICRVIESLSTVDRSLGVSIGLHSGLGLRGLNFFGCDDLKSRFLPDLASGEKIACFAVTEAQAGSDLAAMQTTAQRDGDDLVINGTKVYVTNGGIAKIATIVARTPELGGSRRGHSMIMVPLDQPGVIRGAEEHKLGIRGSSTRSLYFENVRVPLDHIIGEPSQGLRQLNHVLSWGRILMSSGCLGLARSAYRRALDQVTNRMQFGRHIFRFGMVQRMLADMRFRIHAMECLLRLVAWLEDEQPASIEWETAVAKVYCSESAWLNADDAVQLHGGSGFIEETGIARLMRDARISRIFEGANELMRYHMSSVAYTWPTKKMLDVSWVESHDWDQLLQPDVESFHRAVLRLMQEIGKIKKTHGLKCFQRQMEQQKIADACIGLYTWLAVLVRAQGAARAGGLNQELIDLTRYGTSRISTLIEKQFGDLTRNADDLAEQIAISECDKAMQNNFSAR